VQDSNANDLSLQKLIELGAKTLLVPGNLPIGCVPAYLVKFSSDNVEDYDPETGCIRWMNKFSQYHNKLLVKALKKLRKRHPGVEIIYADYYGAAMEVFLSPENFGELKAFYYLIRNQVAGCKKNAFC
jgi:phospholipase/lecithinase/hemolysin